MTTAALTALHTPDIRRRIVQATYAAGFAGVIVIALTMLMTALVYRGTFDQPYSPVNHFVSELGEIGVSELALLFNTGLIVGGLFLIAFIFGMVAFMGNWYGVIFGAVGLLMGISGALVGVFPMNHLEAHMWAAANFFNLGVGSMALFSLYVIFFRQRDLPLWLLVPALLTGLAFFAFVIFSPPLNPNIDPHEVLHNFVTNRPNVAELAVLEWVVVGTILGWITTVSLYLRSWVNGYNRSH